MPSRPAEYNGAAGPYFRSESHVALEESLVDEADRKLLDRLQADFPLVPRPFAVLAQELGWEEQEVIERVQALHEAGLIRRVGPILDPARIGRVGTLAAVAAPPERIEEVAAVVSAHPGVTHNYERTARHGSCPYTLWFTLSAGSEQALAKAVAELSDAIGLAIVRLPTTRKFKIGVRFTFAEVDNDG